MQIRSMAVAVLALTLAAAPAHAGLFGGKKGAPKLPQPPRNDQRLSRHEVHPAHVKPSNSADRLDAGRATLRQAQRRPVTLTNPWVGGLH